MFNKGALGGMMQQVQKMQDNLKKAQEEIARLEITGESGAGMVKVTLTGKHEARRVQIDQSVMDDKDMLEDLIAAAITDAARKVESTTQARMGEVTAGMPIPPGMKLPF